MSEVVLRFDFIVKMLLMYRVFSFFFLSVSVSPSPGPHSLSVCLPACLPAFLHMPQSISTA